MSNLILSDVRFLYNARDLSGDGNAIEIVETITLHDDTVFTDTGLSKRPGLPGGKFSYAGFAQYSDSPEAVELTLANLKGTTTGVPVLASAGGNAGDRCHFWKASQAELKLVGGQRDSLQLFTVSGELLKGHGILDGVVLESGKTSRASAAQSTAINVGATSATQKVYAIIHVLAFNGTTLTLKIQSDDSGGGSYTDRFTQAGITAIGAYYLVPLAGALTDTHWRVDWSGTFTSFQAAVAIAIRANVP